MHRLLIGSIVAFLLLALPASAGAITKGVVSGVVSDNSGPVGNARVLFFPGNGSGYPSETHTDGSGNYAAEVWPDTYRVAVLPNSGSPDGFADVAGIVLPDGGSATANLALPAAGATGQISGVASYADHSPDAGVEVWVGPERFESGVYQNQKAVTDESGNWSIGGLPTGIYRLTFYVIPGGPMNQQDPQQAANSQVVFLDGGQSQVATTLTGPKPGALVGGTVIAAEGWPSRESQIAVSQVGGGSFGETGLIDDEGHFRFRLPSGTYRIGATGGYDESDGTGEVTISVTGGQVSLPTIHLPPLDLPAGAQAQHSAEHLAWLNQQRARWGLPGGVVEVPLWSRGCAAHNDYGVRNGLLEHPEVSSFPSYSPGGNWAGTHSVLAGGGGWDSESTPWNDAPIHYNQLMTPGISLIGLSTNGQSCATTWPGLHRTGIAPGTIFTFPGDGTAGVPPVELAAESPTTPNRELGVPDLAGRQLFVYEFGTEKLTQFGFTKPTVLSASLRSASGSVPVKWIDGSSGISGYLSGAIIVPTKPLEPFTDYTATVRLGGVESFVGDVPPLPPVTHTWSFKTGRDNPGGVWGETRQKARSQGPRRMVRTKWQRGRIIVRGFHFQRGKVLIKRKVLLRSKRRLDGQTLARARANRKGKFVARFRWPKKHIAFRVFQNGKSTFGIYNPPTPSGKH